MKNKKKLILVIALAVLLVAAAVVACLFIFGGKGSGRTTITFEGIEEIHAPAGTVTEESLLAGVTAKDSKGNSKKVTVDLGGADLSKPGRYVIEYKCGEEIKREVVYIYGSISYQVNGTGLEGEKVDIPFSNAITSLNFTKIVSATDSFGNELDVVKVEGDPFDYLTGEYTVKYTVTDKAGQTLEKTITYTVTSQINMTVQADVSVKYEQETATFKVDLDGENDIWLMANGGLVSIADYAMTEKGLVLYASYFRTLAPGENTLKLCSVNGSTEFTFTVVDTGKPLFTFDSIYKTYIIAGNAAVYEMPQTQIAGHEYSYTYKITKDGVSYKAQQVGDSILITTSSGKNLSAGIYDITVTATNKADTSKKTTIKRDFRIYTNQAEIDGWKFGNDGNGSKMVSVDLSDKGYYRPAWQYDAKSPNSWNGRLFWKDATKATFQNVTFDFYVYSLGVAEKENGKVSYVGKNADMTVPFSAGTMSGDGVAMIIYDMKGNIVDKSELKMNTWYTMKLDTSEILHAGAEKTDMVLYPGVSNKWQVGMYIAEMHFWAYEGAGAQHVFKDEDKTVSMERNGGKSNLVSGKLDNESVINYTVTEKHIPGTALKRALKVTLTDTSKEVISIDFKYLEEVKDAKGNVLDLSMYVQNKDDTRPGVFGANYAIVDAETNEPTVKLEVGKWYTLYITANGNKNFIVYPMGKADTQLTCKAAFKNLQTYDVDMPGALLFSDSGNIAPSGMYKMPDGEWGISYASYSGWDATPNTAYYRRIIAKLNSDKYSEIRFQFRYSVSDYLEKESTEFVQDFNLLAPNITVVDDDFNAVAKEDRQLGVWYTAVIASSDGSPLAKSFEMYPQGYNDGGKDDQIVNVELQFRNVVAVETKPIPVHTNNDNTVSLQAASGKSDLSAGVDAEAGMLVYTNTKEQMPSAPDSRAMLLKVLEEGKNIVKFSFMFESASAPDGTPLAPDMYVADEQRGGYWRRAESAITDENGKPVANLEVGKWYTMWITTEGQTEFRVYPMGMIGDQQVLCKMLVKDMETANVEIGGAHFVSNDGGTFGAVGLYQNGEGKWEYFGSAYDRYSSWIPGYNGKPKNLADYRKTRLTLDADDYVVASFEFQYQVSRYLKLEDPEAVWTNNLGLIAEPKGHVLTVLDADGNEVAAANRQIGVWYTAIIKKNDGTALNQSIPMYTCGYSGTNDGQSVEMEILLRNPKAAKGTVVHTNADNTISIQSAGMVDALIAEEGGVRYKMDKATAATTNMTDRAINVKRLEGNTKGLIKMELVLNSAKDQNDQDVSPWIIVENANGWNSYVLVDKDGNAVKEIKADGNSYFLYITTKDTKSDNDAFTFYPVGRGGEQVYADMLIKNVEAIEVQTPVASFTVPDGQSYMNVGVYADENGQHVSMQSYQPLHAMNTSWRRRVAMTLDSDQYLSLSFQIRYAESKYNGETRYQFSASGFTVNYFDDSFNAVAEKDLQDGVWYNAILTKNDGSALPTSGYTFYTVTSADGDDEYKAGKYVELAFQLRNFKGTTAEDIGIFNNDDNSVTLQSAGAKEVLEKEELTGAIRYQLVAEKMPYSTMDTAMKVTLNDTAKQVISMKFTVNTLTNANGDPVNPWLRVVTTSGNEANFAVIDENGDLVKNIAAGKTYTLFITSPEFATNLYEKPSVPTEFLVYPVGMDSPAIADMTIAEVKTHAVGGFTTNEGNVTHTTTMVHNNISYYQVGENWNVSYTVFTALYRGGTTAVVTNCTASARAFTMTLPGENIESLNLRMRFVEGSINGVENYTFSASGAALNDHTVTFYKDGIIVAPADRKAGEWYDVVITKSGGYVRNTLTFYFQGFADGTNENPVDVMVQMADVQVLEPDTNPIAVTARDTNNLSVLRSVVDGKNIYTMSTYGVSQPGTSSWQWTGKVTAPDNTHTHMAVTFKFNSAMAADGVTPIDPTMTVYRGSSINSGLNMWIYDETGKLVDSGNQKAALELGKWYTLIIENPASDLQTSYYLRPCFAYSGAAKFSVDIKDRTTYISGEKITTPGAMADAGLLWTEADGWHWFVYNNENSIAADQRYANIVLPEDGKIMLEYEVKFNSLSGEAEAYVGLMQGVNTFYDLETSALIGTSNTARLEVGKWYRVSYATNNAANMGTTAWTFGYLGGFKAGNASVSMRNFTAKSAPEYTVTFNLNGAEGTVPTPITKLGGAAYGELPVVASEGYTFGGWFKDAACSGTAVTATDTISSNHVLYAKWTMNEDTNPITITARDVNNLTVTRSIVNGENVYTSTSVGVTSPGTSSWQWATAVTAPDNTHKYMAVKFRITSAFASDGTTPIDPTMTVWRGSSITSGVSMWIYDAETGDMVDSGNNKKALELNKWYTVVIENPTGALQSKYYLVPCYSYAGAAKFTMEITDRACTADPGLSQGDIKFETVWGDFADPNVGYIDNAWCYAINGSAQSVAADHRQLNVTLTPSNVKVIEFEFMMNGLNGTAVSLPGGVAKTITNLDGSEVAEFQTGTWYKATAISNTAFATTRFIFGYLGGYEVGGLNCYIRNVKCIKEEVTFTTPGDLADPVASFGAEGLQYTIAGSTTGNIAPTQRHLNVVVKDATATQLAFEFKMSNLSGGAAATFANVGAGLTVKYYDMNGVEVAVGALSVDVWYKMVVTKGGAAMGSEALDLGRLGGSSRTAGTLDFEIRNVVVTAP